MKHAWLNLAATLAIGSSASAQTVSVAVLPTQPLIERSTCCQLLNFDLELTTSGADTLVIDAVEATLLDARGRMIGVRRVNRNGMLPSVATLSAARVAPKGIATVYNPFYSLDRQMPVASLHYRVELSGKSGPVVAETSVTPRFYATKTDLVLPVRGRVLVHDGHDFYSHHRRMEMSVLRQLGVNKGQFNRYAYDFSLVDPEGKLNRTGGKTNEDWFGYGTTVVAPGDGIVRYARNDAPENRLPDGKFDEQNMLKDPWSIPGNYVEIDHGNGECSGLAHMKQGSVMVKVGDRVRRGQPIGQMGLSGDSDWLPHVHYQLMDRCDFLQAEGIPSYFSDFRRVAGDTTLARHGQVDTGDIIITPTAGPPAARPSTRVSPADSS